MKFSVRLILSVVVVAVIVVPILSFGVFLNGRSILQEHILNDQLESATYLMDRIDRILFRAYQDIQVIGEEDLFEELLEEEKFVMNEKMIDEKALLTGPWNIIFIVDNDGIIIASTDEKEIGRHIAEAPKSNIAYHSAMMGEVYYSDLIISDNTSWPTIIFAAPIRGEKNPERPVLGAVIANFDWPVVTQLLDNISASTHVHLLNKDGIFIGGRAISGMRILETSFAEDELVKKVLAEKVMGASAATTMIEEDIPILAAYVLQNGYLTYRGCGWGLLMEPHKKAEFAPVNMMAVNISIIVTLIMAVLTGIFYFIGKLLIKPVENLNKTVNMIGFEDLSVRAEVKTKDEIGELAHSFNQMVVDLSISKEEIIAAKDYTDNIIKSMVDTLIVVDPEGKIKKVNQSALDLLGYTEEELAERDMNSVFTDEVFTKTKLREFIKEGGLKDYETAYKTKDGKKIPVLLSGAVMRDKAGNIVSVVCVAKDITERIKAEEELKTIQNQLIQSEKMSAIGRLSAGVAHEIKNPLAIIQLSTEDLEEYLPQKDEKIKKSILMITESCQRANNVITDLLNFSHITEMDFHKIKLNEVIDTSVALVQNSARINNITVEWNGQDIEGIELEGGFNLLQQVFLNLLTNAIDAIKENGKITITAELEKAYGDKNVVVKIADTGPGIPENRLSRIFDPFYTTKEPGNGTGLGLSMVYTIIDKHKGIIEAESRIGKGTTFIIILPVAGP